MPRNLEPTFILDGLGVFAVASRVAITIFDVPLWTVETVDRLYRETLALSPTMPFSLSQQLGSHPNAAVRKRITELQQETEANDWYKGERRMCVISDSGVTRGMITAFRWITHANILAYSEADIRQATKWLAGEEGDVAAIERAYHASRALIRQRAS